MHCRLFQTALRAFPRIKLKHEGTVCVRGGGPTSAESDFGCQLAAWSSLHKVRTIRPKQASMAANHSATLSLGYRIGTNFELSDRSTTDQSFVVATQSNRLKGWTATSVRVCKYSLILPVLSAASDTMTLDEHTKLGIAQTTFYIPAVPLAFWLLKRNGVYRPRMAWIPMCMLSLSKLNKLSPIIASFC